MAQQHHGQKQNPGPSAAMRQRCQAFYAKVVMANKRMDRAMKDKLALGRLRSLVAARPDTHGWRGVSFTFNGARYVVRDEGDALDWVSLADLVRVDAGSSDPQPSNDGKRKHRRSDDASLEPRLKKRKLSLCPQAKGASRQAATDSRWQSESTSQSHSESQPRSQPNGRSKSPRKKKGKTEDGESGKSPSKRRVRSQSRSSSVKRKKSKSDERHRSRSRSHSRTRRHGHSHSHRRRSKHGKHTKDGKDIKDEKRDGSKKSSSKHGKEDGKEEKRQRRHKHSKQKSMSKSNDADKAEATKLLSQTFLPRQLIVAKRKCPKFTMRTTIPTTNWNSSCDDASQNDSENDSRSGNQAAKLLDYDALSETVAANEK